MLAKIIALILAFAILAAIFTACGDTGKTATTTGETGDTAPTSEKSEPPDMAAQRALVDDKLPANDFGGKTLNILVRTDTASYFYSENEDADVVNDSLYKRDLAVKERFNAEIKYVIQNGSWAEQANYVKFVRTSVQANDSSFDFGEGYAAYITALAGEKLFYNWLDTEYINLTQPWWSQQCAEELKINNKLFFITGDYSLYMWNCIFIMIFNKQMMADYSVGNLYDKVNNGEWTLDYLCEISKKFYKDNDNDGTQNPGDTFGTGIPISNNIDAIQVMFDCPITVKADGGLPAMNLDSPRFAEITEKVYNFLFNTQGVFAGKETVTIGKELLDMFKAGQTFITTQSFDAIQNLRTMDVDFGIIPYPKLDEKQKSYISVAGDSFTLFFLPATVRDADFTSLMVEALAAESYKKVIPAYYEVALKTKYSRDEESQQMLDLIRDSLTFNFGAINSTGLADIGPAQLLRVAMNSNSTDFASRWQSVKKKVQKNLDKLIEAYE